MANLRHMGGIFRHMGKSHDPLQTQVNCIVSHIANLKKHLKIWVDDLKKNICIPCFLYCFH